MAMGNRWVDEEQKPTHHREKKFVLKAFTGHFRSARHHERRDDATKRKVHSGKGRRANSGV